MKTLRERLTEIVTDVLKTSALELWGLEINRRHNMGRDLKVYIDSPQGVTINDCENVSKKISRILDAHDIIDGSYNLEISSPGIERKLYDLSQYSGYKGYKIKLEFKSSVNGRKRFQGNLIEIENNTLTFSFNDEYIHVKFSNILKGSLIDEQPL